MPRSNSGICIAKRRQLTFFRKVVFHGQTNLKKGSLFANPAVRLMDQNLRLRTPDRGTSRSANPPCPHSGNERRELSPQTQPSVGKSLNTDTKTQFDQSPAHLHRYIRALRRPGLWTNLVHLKGCTFSGKGYIFSPALTDQGKYASTY
jgi:hypothetical protein